MVAGSHFCFPSRSSALWKRQPDSILALEYLFHVGQYPSVNGRKRDLVTREGKIGNWQDSEILDDPNSD